MVQGCMVHSACCMSAVCTAGDKGQHLCLIMRPAQVRAAVSLVLLELWSRDATTALQLCPGDLPPKASDHVFEAQMRDRGSMEDILFENITVNAQHCAASHTACCRSCSLPSGHALPELTQVSLLMLFCMPAPSDLLAYKSVPGRWWRLVGGRGGYHADIHPTQHVHGTGEPCSHSRHVIFWMCVRAEESCCWRPVAGFLLIRRSQVESRLLTLYDCRCEPLHSSTATSAGPAGSRQCCCGRYSVIDITWLAVLAATGEPLN